MSEYKDFAIEIAERAGKIIRSHFTLGIKTEWKSDNSPVTQIDKMVNSMVIDSVKKYFPDHGVLGEEQSYASNNENLWVCDPLDGTVAFSHGLPTFTFSLALTKNGESLLGIILDPILGRLVFAEKGGGAFLNEKPIYVSKGKILNEKSFINLDTDVELFNAKKILLDIDCYVSTIYSSLYASMLVACGEFEAEIFEYSSPWDAAAAKIIVEEAGGKVTDIYGNDQRYDKKIKGYIASNGLVHNQLVSICKKAKQ